MVEKKRNRIMLASQSDYGLTKEQRMDELREKLNFKSKLKVSLDVTKVRQGI